MKKLAVGVLILVFVLAAPAFWIWTVIRRADAAIDVHEVRVAAEIASLRSRFRAQQAAIRDDAAVRHSLRYLITGTSDPPQDDTEWLDSVVRPRQTAQKHLLRYADPGLFHPYEQDSGRRELMEDWEKVNYYKPERIPTALALLYELHRGSGSLGPSRLYAEGTILQKWGALLREQEFAPAVLERMAVQLKRLHENRPALLDELTARHVCFCRARILQARDPAFTGAVTQPLPPPGRNSLYSRKIQTVRSLADAEKDLAFFREIDRLPVREREQAFDRLWPSHSLDGYINLPDLYSWDAAAEANWALALAATAVARFQADQKRFPESFEELVPRYLDRGPECPLPGKTIKYELGVVVIPGANQVWVVKQSRR